MKKQFISIVSVLLTYSAFAADGLISLNSEYSFQETTERLENALHEKNVNIFNMIDHANGAANADLELNPTMLFIIGNPMIGTPLMQCAQTAAIDLPQKLLVWEDSDNSVWVSYNEPQYTIYRHNPDCYASVSTVDTMTAVLNNFAMIATGR